MQIREFILLFKQTLVVQAVQVVESALAAIALMPFVALFERYVFDDWRFLPTFWVVFTLDMASGIVKHWKAHTFDFRQLLFKGSIKLFVCVSTLIFFHTLTHYESAEVQAWAMRYVHLLKDTMILVYIGGSFIFNADDISNGKLIPSIIKKRFINYNNDTGQKIEAAK